jgi:hypothetical protein
MANNNENHLQRIRICDSLEESKLITFSFSQRISQTFLQQQVPRSLQKNPQTLSWGGEIH